jgi:hypothetical protein
MPERSLPVDSVRVPRFLYGTAWADTAAEPGAETEFAEPVTGTESADGEPAALTGSPSESSDYSGEQLHLVIGRVRTSPLRGHTAKH